MKEYRVERMTFENYHNMMMGSHYHMEAITVIAESKEQAVELAKKDGYMVNEKYVRTVEEIRAEEEERAKRVKTHVEYICKIIDRESYLGRNSLMATNMECVSDNDVAKKILKDELGFKVKEIAGKNCIRISW